MVVWKEQRLSYLDMFKEVALEFLASIFNKLPGKYQWEWFSIY